MKTYEATVTRDGRFWLIRIPGIGSTQARHLREMEAMGAGLVEAMTDAAPSTFTVEYAVEVPAEARAHLARAAKLREASARANSDAAAEVRTAARSLASTGMPLRDIGQVLGVSYQRAHQLVH